MSTIAIFVNDPALPHAALVPLVSKHRGSRWIVVACPPRLTRHIGRYASHASRRQWRREWCGRLFTHLAPLFDTPPNTMVAEAPIEEIVRGLRQQHGDGLQLVDARCPRLGAAAEPLVPTLVPADRWTVPVLVGSGLSLALALAD